MVQTNKEELSQVVVKAQTIVEVPQQLAFLIIKQLSLTAAEIREHQKEIRDKQQCKVEQIKQLVVTAAETKQKPKEFK